MKKILNVLTPIIVIPLITILLTACEDELVEVNPTTINLQVAVKNDILKLEIDELEETNEVASNLELEAIVIIEAISATADNDELEIPMPSNATIEFDFSGDDLWAIEFTDEGIFEYRVFQEIDLDEESLGLTIDETVFYVNITVELDNDELVVTIDNDEITFVNTYDIAITKVQTLVEQLSAESSRAELELALTVVEAITTNETIQTELLLKLTEIDNEITMRGLI